MIQSTIKQNFIACINTKANQIMLGATSFYAPIPADTSAGFIALLVKFTNDMTGDEIYVYPIDEINDRYTKMGFIYNSTPNMFARELNLTLAGYWKYEVYEVWFAEMPKVPNHDYFPKNENVVLDPPAPNKGIVKGLVAIGKMYAAETPGEEEVQYKEYVEPNKKNYTYNG